MKRISKLISKISLNKISLVVVITFSIFMGLIALLYPTSPMGESDDYMLTTVAFEINYSPYITQEVIDKAKKDFKDHARLLGEGSLFQNGKTVMPPYKFDKLESHYFGLYSLWVLPTKLIFKILGLNQSYSFAFANALIYCISIWLVFKKMKVEDKAKLFIILFLIFNPTIYYVVWASAEIFIASMVIISLVFLHNKNYKLSAIFVSLAGTMNITIMVYGATIILFYFYDKYLELEESENNLFEKIIKMIKNNFFDSFKFATCFVIVLVPPILRFIKEGQLVTMQKGSSTNNLFERFWAYLFDLNLGMLPYYNLVLMLFFLLIFWSVVNFNIKGYLYAIAFLGTVLSYSIMSHINCGMTAIARYNSWASPMIGFFMIMMCLELKNTRIFRAVYSISMISLTISGLLIFYLGLSKARTTYKYFNPVAQVVLNNYPELYNPYYATFISRTTHIDGGYTYSEPVIYTTQNGYVRKILVTPNTAEYVKNMVTGESSSLKKLDVLIKNAQNKRSFSYINVSNSDLLKLK